MYSGLSRAAELLARWMAYAGGVVLLALTVATCLSIIGRAFVPLNIGVGPILGIEDLTEIGIAVGVFAFLPWCQVQRGHASVDLIASALPRIANKVLDLLIDVLMLIAAVVIGWRMYLGLLDKQGYGETTQIMQIPVWWAYAASLPGAVVFALITAFCVLRSIRALADFGNLEGQSDV
jgi:TRAP-type C4-dicarboxylate transport system permease small subunit